MLLTSSLSFSQSIPQDLLTSDPSWNMQIQMLISQYGVAKTREMVNEYRRQQQIQQNQSMNNNRPVNSDERVKILHGVYVVDNQVKELVRLAYSEGRIRAYSYSRDMIGREDWNSIVPTTPSGILPYERNKFTDNHQFKNKITVKGGTIYFNID